MLDFNQIVLTVLPIILPPIIGMVSVFYKQQVSRLPQNLQPIVSQLAGQAVSAAEQSLSDQNGATKFSAASSWLSECLSRYGIKLTQGEIKSVIEEAVFVLNQSSSTAAPQPVPAQGA